MAAELRAIAGKAGFTLIEIGIALAILALLAGVMVPEVLSRMRTGQTAAISGSLNALGESLTQFREDVGRYPSQLVYLASQPPAGALDTCDRVIPLATSRWNGPYLDRNVTTGGILVATSTIENDVDRTPATFSATGTMLIDVLEVDQEVANELEESFDTSFDLATGTIRWTAVGGSGQGTLTYATPIRGC